MHHNRHAGHQHHHANMERRQEGPATVVQFVYKTAAKTFDGPVGGYMTVPTTPQSTPDSSSNSNGNSISNDNSNVNSDSQQAAQQSVSEASALASVPALASSSAVSTAVAEASPSAAATQNQQKSQVTSTSDNTKNGPTNTVKKASTSSTQMPVAVATSQVSSPSPTSSFLESTSSTTPSHATAASTGSPGGMSSGGKAGLAIGILLLLGALFALAFFIYRRKRSQTNEEYSKADDEKSAYAAGGVARSQSTASTKTTATAPRLSLRPITEFHPDFAARGKAANPGAAAAAGVAGGTALGVAMAQNQNSPANPFSNHAAVAPSRRFSDEKTGLPIQSNMEYPFTDNARAPPPTNGSILTANAPASLEIRTLSPEAAAAAGAATVAGAAAGVAAAKAIDRKGAPNPLSLTPNRTISPASHSPAVSEFSQTPVSPGAMAHGPPPGNVHRIQIDFKPSMDDELSLRAGHLVRLLHEYDDGWALCIRLDRSQQGVAPRTCLSARPVKPRPPPGARGPVPRGPPPPGMMGPGSRSASPAPSGRGSPSPYGRAPRPSTAGGSSQQRSMSPGPYGGGPQRPANIVKRRSNSASDLRERMSPPGPSTTNPNIQKVSMRQQGVNSPDPASITSRSPPTSMMPPRKPVAGQAI